MKWPRNNEGRSTIELGASANSSRNILEVVFDEDPVRGAQCQDILYEASRRLGDMDALYGCGTNFLFRDAGRLNHMLQEKKYFKALGLLDIGQGRVDSRRYARGSRGSRCSCFCFDRLKRPPPQE